MCGLSSSKFINKGLIVGGQQLIGSCGVNEVVTSSELNSRGGNVYYDVIPYEFLYTDETQPQVIVTVDGMDALCTTLSCDYVYEPVTEEISSMVVSGLSVTIGGTNLPSAIASVTVADTNCVVSSNDATTISCDLASPLIAGDWKPVVKHAKGLIPNASTLAATSVPLVVSSISPKTNLNPAGGVLMTIAGSGFPSSIDNANVKLDFSDGRICDIESCTPTEMTCRTRAGNPNRRMLFG